jgi:ABC-type spermidine/putrescine transport system permease subunit I
VSPSAASADLVTAPVTVVAARRSRWPEFVLVSPALILTAGFVLSLATLLAASVFGSDGNFTLEHYRRIAFEPMFRDYLWVTLRISLWTVVAALLMALSLAFWIVRTPRRWLRALLIMCVTVPFLTSMIVRLYAFTIILGNTGLVNQFLRWSGMVDADGFISLLRHEPGVIIGTTAFVLPFMTFMLMGSFRRMDSSLEEAAFSLGADPLTTFWRVTLPLLLPGIAAAASLGFVLASVAFSSPLVLGGGSVIMVANAIYSEAVQVMNRGLAAALAILSLLLTFAVLYPARRYESKGHAA